MTKIKKQQIVTTGKVPTNQKNTLDEIWGYTGLTRYGTIKEEEYREKLKNMSRADLEAEARLREVFLCESTERLTKNLLNKFRSFVGSLNKPANGPISKTPVNSAVQKILSEGR